MNYFDVFAGAGGFSLGMPKHYKCVGLSEIDKYCNAVLKHNFPDYINYGDISNIKWEDTPDFDLLIGGSPCHGLSLAGKRKGLSDDRSILFYEYIRCLKEKKPKYFVWENVSGALQTNDGEDFENVKKSFSEAGYSFVWQVVDSADFGVPLRRERVFIAGYLGELPKSEVLPFGQKDDLCSETRRKLSPLLTASDAKGITRQRQRIIIRDKCGLRYFTPLERERLMTWPDNFTKYGIFEEKKVEMSDAQRIKMTGNGVCSTVARALVDHFFK